MDKCSSLFHLFVTQDRKSLNKPLEKYAKGLWEKGKWKQIANEILQSV
jgi:hypothetical protein